MLHIHAPNGNGHVDKGLRHAEAPPVLSPCGHKLFLCTYRGAEKDMDEGNDGRVYHINGALWALESGDGNILWVSQFDDVIKGAPIVVPRGDGRDDLLCQGAYNGKCYIIQCSDGAVVTSLSLDGHIYASPLLSTSTDTDPVVVTATTSGQVMATKLSFGEDDGPTTTSIWQHEGEFGPIYATPCLLNVAEQEHIVLASVTGRVSFLNAASGQTTWYTTFPQSIFSSPTVIRDNVCVIGCHDGIVRCVDAHQKSILWIYDVQCSVFTKCFHFGAGNNLAVTTTAGRVIVFQPGPKSVEILNYSLPAECFSAPSGSLSFGGGSGKLVVGARDDRLYSLSFG